MNGAKPSAVQTVPDMVCDLLGPAPLIRGESAKRYDALFDAIAEAIGPRDMVEWLYVKDGADCTWAIWRHLASIIAGGANASCMLIFQSDHPAGVDPWTCVTKLFGG